MPALEAKVVKTEEGNQCETGSQIKSQWGADRESLQTIKEKTARNDNKKRKSMGSWQN